MEMFTFSDRAKMKIAKLNNIADWENIVIVDMHPSMRDFQGGAHTWVEAKYKGKFAFVGTLQA